MFQALRTRLFSTVPVSDAAFVGLVDLIFCSRLPITVVGITLSAAGGLLGIRGDPVAISMVVAAPSLATLRLLVLNARHRRRTRALPVITTRPRWAAPSARHDLKSPANRGVFGRTPDEAAVRAEVPPHCFTAVNDPFGHPVGDGRLQAPAARDAHGL